MIRIGVDLLGSDTPQDEIFTAIELAASALNGADRLTLFATPAVLEDCLDGLTPAARDKVESCPVEQEILMTDDPVSAVKKKPNSSIVTAIHRLRNKQIDAFLTLGNTGALLASAAMILDRFPGIDRPALLVEMPTAGGVTAILDVGANVHCRAAHLVTFAYLGAAYQKTLGIAKPRVGLLNIGAEAQKGSPLLREVFRLLKEDTSPAYHFSGNIEGNEAFNGIVDVLVTDGFVGNIFLKTAEGMYAFLLSRCGEHKPVLPVSPSAGAVLCGIDGLVIKCHGASTGAVLAQAITRAYGHVCEQFISRMKAYYTSSR